MNRENTPGDAEKAPIEMTKDQWNTYSNMDTSDPALKLWMEEKGIEFDSGPVLAKVGDEPFFFETSKGDFGTKIIEEEPGE